MLAKFFSQAKNTKNPNQENAYLNLPRDVHSYMHQFFNRADLIQLNRVSKKMHDFTNSILLTENIKFIEKTLSDRGKYACLADKQIKLLIDFLIKNNQAQLGYDLLQNMIMAEKNQWQELLVLSYSEQQQKERWLRIIEEKFKIAGIVNHQFLFSITDNKEHEYLNFECAVKLACLKK